MMKQITAVFIVSIMVILLLITGALATGQYALVKTWGSLSPITAVDDKFSGIACYVNFVELGNVLDNDFPHSDTMQVEIVQDPLHGTAIVGGSVGYPPNEYLENGYLEFLPDSGWYGDDLLEYHVYDGQGYSNSATVSISIIRSSQMCDGTDIILNTPQDMPVRGAFPCGGSREREIWLTSEPEHGSLAIIRTPEDEPDAIEFIYTPVPGFTGTDTFSYMPDGNTESCGDYLGKPGTVTIHVQGNIPEFPFATFPVLFVTLCAGAVIRIQRRRTG